MSALLTDRHVKYWLRCAKTFLPPQYTPNDSSRMTLAFFTLSALDLLSVLESKTTTDERTCWVNWIYHCQLPTGGFRGFSGTDFGSANRSEDNANWDPANLPATFFAIISLLILGDDLSNVKRNECLRWLVELQGDNGSFEETLGQDVGLDGGNDLRFCCCAAGIRHILRGTVAGEEEELDDFDVDKLVTYISSCQASLEFDHSRQLPC